MITKFITWLTANPAQIGWKFLQVYHQPFIKPQFFFSISMKNGCLVTTVYNFVIKCAWTFFFYHYMLGTTVKCTSYVYIIILMKNHFPVLIISITILCLSKNMQPQQLMIMMISITSTRWQVVFFKRGAQKGANIKCYQSLSIALFSF